MKHDACCQEAVVRCALACRWASFEKLDIAVATWLAEWIEKQPGEQ